MVIITKYDHYEFNEVSAREGYQKLRGMVSLSVVFDGVRCTPGGFQFWINIHQFWINIHHEQQECRGKAQTAPK